MSLHSIRSHDSHDSPKFPTQAKQVWGRFWHGVTEHLKNLVEKICALFAKIISSIRSPSAAVKVPIPSSPVISSSSSSQVSSSSISSPTPLSSAISSENPKEQVQVRVLDPKQAVACLSIRNPTERLSFIEQVTSIQTQGHRLNVSIEEDGIYIYHTSAECRGWQLAFPGLFKEVNVRSWGKWDSAYNLWQPCGLETEKTEEAYWQERYEKMKTEIGPTPLLTIPEISEFVGSVSQISSIFDALLMGRQGALIGEKHVGTAPEVLTKQMEHLKKLGVTLFFLEHVCYDTFQCELDEFFRTKEPSPFLKAFLSNGCGEGVGKVDYFGVVEAAVKAGIRPVGLETSETQMISYQAFGGAGGASRIKAMNLCAKEIIDRETSLNGGKYIALVGSAHVSYVYGVAGLSEFCQVPAVVIESASATSEPICIPNCKNLDLTDPKTLISAGLSLTEPHQVAAYIRVAS